MQQKNMWMSGILCAGLVSSCALADIPDVKKVAGGEAYSSAGNDLTIDVAGAISDGDALLIVVGASGNANDTGKREVTTVSLEDRAFFEGLGQPLLSLIRVGYEDSDASDARVEIWKLDNKTFDPDGPTSYPEGDYDTVAITFPAGNDRDATYAYAFVLDKENTVDMVRLFGGSDETTATTLHDITPFVLEPDAMVITAHLYTNAAQTIALSCTGNEIEDWNKSVTADKEGFLVQHATPNAAATKIMTATTSVNAESVTCAVVIRSDRDIVHTPLGTPGALGNKLGSNAAWWLEGLTATEAGNRTDITSYGNHMSENRATWLRQSICDGNRGTGHKDIGDKSEGHDLDPMDFSPLNPNREADFEMYILGLAQNLDLTILPNSEHRHIASWSTYGGVVIWDFEFFPLEFRGTVEGNAQNPWGGANAYNPPPGTPEWEYDAAVRYFWERVHQWFVEVYANEGVEALVYYNHPQGPTMGEGLESGNNGNWTGKWWEDQLDWVFKMQGAFDGHCFPVGPLGENATDIETWCRNVFENFAEKTNDLNVFCYVSHWPARTEYEAYMTPLACRAIIDASDTIRTHPTAPWTDFDEYFPSPIPIGKNWDDAFTILTVDATAQSITISGDQTKKIDPIDQLTITGSTLNDGTYDFVNATFDGNTPGETTVFVTSVGGPLEEGGFVQGTLNAPAKDKIDFNTWWSSLGINGVLVKQLADKYD